MKILISPAKSLDFESKIDNVEYTKPIFLDKTSEINSVLKLKTPSDLMKLQGISQKLSDLNWKRNKDYTDNHNHQNSRPAIFAFNGDVYAGIDVKTLSKEKINDLQKSLRILSGYYGILKPLDLIQPYRLEMGTKLPVNGSNNLYNFWSDNITKSIVDDMAPDELLVNLASNEYFSAFDKNKFDGRIISPIFKDLKNGKLKIISFYAKKARGLMVRYIVDNNVSDYDDLLGFNLGNYSYNASETTEKNKPVFTR
tara:strand:- start:971 stop:1732 length:762 start_codon:yes stop_codon:yes gene_type:complete